MIENTPFKKKVLFLCTGNYYRSRFAEIYFNHKAKNIGWIAYSRGLGLDPRNEGEISMISARELSKLGISIGKQPYPQKAELTDLEDADMIIGLNKSEHEEMVEEKFTQFKDRVVYWNIADIFEKDSSSELPKIINNVDRLIAQLSS